MSSPTVFISYSHVDESWKDRLVTQLKVFEFEGEFAVWDDRRIEGGDDWQPEIEKAMDAASVAILIVSAEFLISKFIRGEEVPRLLERRANEGLRVFPVIARPCPWQSVGWLSRMQARPTDGKPLSAGNDYEIDTNLSAIAEEIADLLKRAVPSTGSNTFAPLPPDRISLARLPSTDPTLFGREKELAFLDDSWANPQTNIISLVAWGGVGKTALVNVWLNRIGQDSYRGAEKVYGWSFYSQGAAEGGQASADLFIANALTWFGDPNPDEGSPWDKGERLAELVSKQRTLLVLDGMEPLQYPPGDYGQEGKLKDPGLQSLLRSLARYNPGLCVISTRLDVDDLKDFIGGTHQSIDLEELSLEAGAQLLEHLGTNGTPDELQEAVDEYEGHALALTLLGRYVATVYDGDIRQRDKIASLSGERRQGDHARRVMESYEKWFEGKPELDILNIMGLFDRPVEQGALQALIADPGIPGLTTASTRLQKGNLLSQAVKVFGLGRVKSELASLSYAELKNVLTSLREAKLISEVDTDSNTILDCHPLVREHFGEKLNGNNPNAWKDAHRRLYEYYKEQAPELPDTLEEMAPLFAAVSHGCQAERYQEAMDDIFYSRIDRGRAFVVKNLGAINSSLAAISSFFIQPWDIPAPELDDEIIGYVLGNSGYCLRALGRLKEASQPMQASLESYISQENWNFAAIMAGNVSELYLIIGDIPQAVHYAQQGINFSDQDGDAFQRMIDRSRLASALHQTWLIQEAQNLFFEAEKIQNEGEPNSPILYSIPGFQFCDLLLDQGKLEDVHNRANQTMEIAINYNLSLNAVALDHLSLGRAYLQETQQEGRDDYSNSNDHLDSAVDGLRQSGEQGYLPLGLLARAELYRTTNELEQAQHDLDEVMSIAERGGMSLYEADCRLEYARLYVAMGNEDKAQVHFVKGRDMVNEMGYGRRFKEVEELAEQLGMDAEADKQLIITYSPDK